MSRAREVPCAGAFVVAPIESIYRAVRRAAGCRDRDRRLGPFRYTLFAVRAGRAGVAGPALGAPAAALLAEQLTSAGARELLLLSACGSLTRDMAVGDLFIPTAGISEEGTSRLYGYGETPPPDRGRLRNLEEACRLAGAAPHKGAVWTTDAPHRETPEKVAAFLKSGALAVDMEFTALAAVTGFHGIGFAALMVVSDLLVGSESGPCFRDRRFSRALEEAARISVSLVRTSSP